MQSVHIALIRHDGEHAAPEFTVTAAASASRSAHDSPGNACHTARAARPSWSAAMNCAPPL